ncbi:MAG: DinB family protein [Gemmatimonadota bacterium]|nr:DinB family protein [Gemmatimonadota bacterium]MDH5761005.1 DinB family protein [Gemmatimonadota bacterium]
MSCSRIHALVPLVLLLAAAPVSSQSAPTDLRTELGRHFEGSARKVVALAAAMPADSYDWRPTEGVASVVEVYMHIARYNYMYPDENLGIPAPVAYADLEEDVVDKEEALEILAASMDHVRGILERLSSEELEQPARLYGRDVTKWAVLLQLVAHMNEHLGQSIAYARTNQIAPPWSG